MSSSAHPSFQSPLCRASALFEESVSPLIPDATVYIDSQFAAVLRSSLPDGLSVFLDAGAWNIKSIVKSSELSLQRNDDKLSVPDSDKLLILISSHISDYLDHIKHILSSDVYSKVSIVVSSPIRLPPSTLASINDPEVDIDSSFDQHSDPELLTSKITSWMMMGYKNMKRVLPSEDALEVHLDLLPLNWISIVQDLVALKSLPVDSSAKFQQIQDTIPLQQSFHDLAKELFVLFEGMNLIPSIYAMGTSSSYVGKTMHNLRLKLQSPDAGKAEATLILMDRSLDLVTPNIHSDNLMDQIFKLLPRQVKSKKDGIKSNDPYTETLLGLYPELNEESRGSEVYISLDPLIDDSSRKILSASLSDPHMRVSLRHHQDPQIINLFDDMINLPQKDSLTSVRSRIIDLITSHASPVKLPRILGKVSLNQLTKLLTGFVSSDPDNSLEKGGKLLEVIQGVVECLNESQNQNYESFQSLEKILLLSLSSSECSDPIGTLKNQVTSLFPFSVESKSKYPVSSFLKVLEMVYSFLGDKLINDEGEQLKEVLVSLLARGIVREVGEKSNIILSENQDDEDGSNKKKNDALNVDEVVQETGNADDGESGWDLDDDTLDLDPTSDLNPVQKKLYVIACDYLRWYFSILDEVAKARSKAGLTVYRNLQTPDNTVSSTSSYTPLIRSVLSDLFGTIESNSPAVSWPQLSNDLKYVGGKSDTELGNMLKGYLGGFAGLLSTPGSPLSPPSANSSAPPNPLNNKVVIIFMVGGGITFSEVKDVRELSKYWKERFGGNVLIGCTGICES